MDKIFELQNIKRMVIQALETVYIIENSKNIDIIVGRFDFLRELLIGTSENEYKGLLYCSRFENYHSYMQSGLESYKLAYYDRIPTQFQLSLIVAPQKADIETLFKKSMVYAIYGYYRDQSKEIKTMKRKDAIEKRKGSIIEKCVHAQSGLFKCKNQSGIDAIINLIDKIMQLVRDDNFDETFEIEFNVINEQ